MNLTEVEARRDDRELLSGSAVRERDGIPLRTTMIEDGQHRINEKEKDERESIKSRSIMKRLPRNFRIKRIRIRDGSDDQTRPGIDDRIKPNDRVRLILSRNSSVDRSVDDPVRLISDGEIGGRAGDDEGGVEAADEELGGNRRGRELETENGS